LKPDAEGRLSKAITIVVLTCFLVLGAATTAILGRDSVPSVSAEMIAQAPPPKPLATNRAAKADRLVPTLALASAAYEPVQVAADKLSQAPVLTEPLRQAFAAATPADFPMPKASTHEAPAATEVPAVEVPAKPKVVAKPQKAYSLLSDMQIAGIRDRLKLSSSQEYYWPSVETALRNVARKIQANKLSNPNAPPSAQIDPNCDEVQQLKSAAMPLLFQLRDDQKEEVRKLARLIGLEKVAQQI
jgi:ABC-type transporter Mla MlaB component